MKLTYNGFTGSVQYDKENKTFFGKVINSPKKDFSIDETYYGKEITELTINFQNLIDFYDSRNNK